MNKHTAAVTSSSIRPRQRPESRDVRPKPARQQNRRQLEQHEASLLPLIRSRAGITIQLLDGSRLVNVVPIAFDRYSIAIEYDGFRETIFKSAIARIITPVEV